MPQEPQSLRHFGRSPKGIEPSPRTHLFLRPRELSRQDSSSILRWDLDGGDVNHSLYWTVPSEFDQILPDADRADHALCAALLYAMSCKKHVHCEGVLSPSLLEGLEELQSVWAKWCPQKYSRIQISAERYSDVEKRTGAAGTLVAFSGGVDSLFSTFRHRTGEAGFGTKSIEAALMVHGMDIPLQDQGTFAAALERSRKQLEKTGISLIPVATNARLVPQLWEDAFGLILGSCLLMFQKRYQYAMNGSEEAYDQLCIPWGATPITTPLVSTSSMRSIEDGGGFNRTEKVGWLGNHCREALFHVRVCWAGKQLYKNCGKCEKCIRTMLNFWVNDLPCDQTFDGDLSVAIVRDVRVSLVQLAFLRELEAAATHKKGRRDPIFRALRSAVRKNSFRMRWEALREKISPSNSVLLKTAVRAVPKFRESFR